MPLAAEFSDWLFAAAVEIREPWPPLWLHELVGHTLLLAWLFAMGASVGSFLNVVVYRLPAGLNLVYPSSHCPRCRSPIRLRHNIPVFGWLLLRGRCRDCRLPISARYPAVELLVGCTFVVIAAAGIYLPRFPVSSAAASLIRPLLDPREFPFWAAYVLHVVLVTTLIGAAWIEVDGKRIPKRLFGPTLLLSLAVPAYWPTVRWLPALQGGELLPWQAGLLDGLAGLAAGALLGLLTHVAWWVGSGRRIWAEFAPVSALAATGALLGWQQVAYALPQVLLLLLFGLLWAAARQRPATRTFPGNGWLALIVAATLALRPPLGPLGDLEFIVTRSEPAPIQWLAALAFCAAILAAGCGSADAQTSEMHLSLPEPPPS